MILRVSGKAFLIVVALLVSAAKLHGQRTLTPMAATQELNRCLSVLRVAASRRGSAAPCPRQVRRSADAVDMDPKLKASLRRSELQPH